jgi:hypothetical protein
MKGRPFPPFQLREAAQRLGHNFEPGICNTPSPLFTGLARMMRKLPFVRQRSARLIHQDNHRLWPALGRAFKAFGRGVTESGQKREKEKQDRLQALRTPQPVSPETCWFCGRSSENGSEAKLQMYHSEQGAEGTPGLHVWTEYQVLVPRCRNCQRVHTIVRHVRLFGWLGGYSDILTVAEGRARGVRSALRSLVCSGCLFDLAGHLASSGCRWNENPSNARYSPYVHNFDLAHKLSLRLGKTNNRRSLLERS